MQTSPLYTVHRYTDEIYKVVAFKRSLDGASSLKLNKDEQQHNDTKLSNNFSRARSMVLQYALCNPWEYFFTGTLSPERWDRNDLSAFSSQLSQKIRDWRKAYGFKLDVLLVPEQHKDGKWHIHGLVNNLPKWCLSHFYWLPLRQVGLTAPYPLDLCEGNFLDWPDYSDTFGYCSLAPVRDPIATAHYVSKYVSKELSQRDGDLGKHLYFHSRPLKKAQKASDVYFPNRGLDDCCDREYEFCKVGMVEDKHWTFPYIWDGVEVSEELMPRHMEQPETFHPFDIDPFYEQLRMNEYSG